jgi:hypothetical protein
MTTDEAEALLARGELDAVRGSLRRSFADGAPADAGWARVCEGAGMSELAVQVWRAVLAHRPEDAEALEALLALHELRGDGRRAEECRKKLAAIGRLPVAPEPEADPGEPLAPSPGDLVRFVHLFGGRAGVHARMWIRGGEVGYAPVHTSLDPALVEAHLRGEITLGSYLVPHGDVTGQIVLDLDVAREAVERAEGHPDRVRALAERLGRVGVSMRQRLTDAGVPCLLVDSGYKGRHLWIFLDPPAPAGAARRLGAAWASALAPADPELSIEVFPKQDRVEAGGLGNLVKLPLGRHLKTGRRCELLDPEGKPVQSAFAALRELPSTTLEALALPGSEPPALTMVPASPAAVELPGVPVAPPSPFTEADLEARPRLAAVLSGCAVLRDVVRRALSDLRVSRDERVVLENTMGHWPEGVEAVNFVLDRVGATDGRMGRPLQGNPTSCKGIRRRLAEVADRVGCDCPFDAPETYPHPLLHAKGLAAAPPPPPPDLDELVERLGRLEARARAIESDLGELRARTAAGLQAAPGGRHRTEAGEWWVEDVEGLPIVRFTPAVQP